MGLGCTWKVWCFPPLAFIYGSVLPASLAEKETDLFRGNHRFTAAGPVTACEEVVRAVVSSLRLQSAHKMSSGTLCPLRSYRSPHMFYLGTHITCFRMY